MPGSSPESATSLSSSVLAVCSAVPEVSRCPQSRRPSEKFALQGTEIS